MNPRQIDVEALSGRVAKLERQNRFWKWSGIFALLALALLFVTGLRAQQARNFVPLRATEVEAQHFVLMNRDGVRLGELQATPDGGDLTLYGPTGQVIWTSTVGPRAVPAQ